MYNNTMNSQLLMKQKQLCMLNQTLLLDKNVCLVVFTKLMFDDYQLIAV